MNELPKPYFQEENPFWQDPAMFYAWLPYDYRPRLTGQDYAYAWMWEVNSPHRHDLPYLIEFLKSSVWKLLWKANLRKTLKELHDERR